MRNFQKVSDKWVDRKAHVWREIEKGQWKCVLCGGISSKPEYNNECIRYEELTDEERSLCPEGGI